MDATARISSFEEEPSCRRLPQATERRLIARAQAGDTAAKERVLLSFVPLAIHIAHKEFRSRLKTAGGPELHDMIQEALVAIGRAIELVGLTHPAPPSYYIGRAAHLAIANLSRRSSFTAHHPRASTENSLPDVPAELSLEAPLTPQGEPLGAMLAAGYGDDQLSLAKVGITQAEALTLRLIYVDGEPVAKLAPSRAQRKRLVRVIARATEVLGPEKNRILPPFSITPPDRAFFDFFRSLRASTQLLAISALAKRPAPPAGSAVVGVAPELHAEQLAKIKKSFKDYRPGLSAEPCELLTRFACLREQAISELAPEHARLLGLRYGSGYTITEIAEMLSVARSRARNQMADAQRELTAAETRLLDLLAR